MSTGGPVEKLARHPHVRIPVFVGPRCIEIADEARARQLAKASNSQVVRRRKDRQIVQINLLDQGADKPLDHPKGNPRRYSHDHENEHNPPQVWTLRRLPSSTRKIYRAVIDSCIKKEGRVMDAHEIDRMLDEGCPHDLPQSENE
jgi:hypothetical protein